MLPEEQIEQEDINPTSLGQVSKVFKQIPLLLLQCNSLNHTLNGKFLWPIKLFLFLIVMQLPDICGTSIQYSLHEGFRYRRHFST